MTQLRLPFCLQCGREIRRRLNRNRRFCRVRCRNAWAYQWRTVRETEAMT